MVVRAVIPAAGQGRRMKSHVNKQYLPLAGKPVLFWTLSALAEVEGLCDLTVVVGPDEVDYCRQEVVEKYGLGTRVRAVIPGGERRQDSVRLGIDSLPEDTELVVIHDGARPLVTPETIGEAVAAGEKYGAVTVGYPLKDTIKEVNQEGCILQTPERNRFWAVQTPQVFRLDWLKAAYQAVGGREVTDDAALVENAGYPVRVIPGTYANLKVTTPEDLIMAEAFLKKKVLP